MATITWTINQNERSDSGVETTASGKTMTTAIEVNVDLAKTTSRSEILKALEQLEKNILESVNLLS